MAGKKSNDARSKARSQARPVARSKGSGKSFTWLWAVLAFILLEGTLVQARMIPSGSMENTILIGDHLLVNRLGYSVGLPYTDAQISLWLNPKRQQIVVFAPPPDEGSNQDLIKRVIGVPGDLIRIRRGQVYVNGKALAEPYVIPDPRNQVSPVENFPPLGTVPVDGPFTPGWAATLQKHVTQGQLRVPPNSFFVMGDNRGDSYDSRYWGFVQRKYITGAPLFVYMSIDAPETAWEPGHIGQRLAAYLGVLVRPGTVRWKHLFRTF